MQELVSALAGLDEQEVACFHNKLRVCTVPTKSAFKQQTYSACNLPCELDRSLDTITKNELLS